MADALPAELLKRTTTKGPSKGQLAESQDLNKTLEAYCVVLGQDRKTRVPTNAKLVDLKILEEVKGIVF